MMFPPFLGFNSYYRRGYGKTCNPYAPKNFHSQGFPNEFAKTTAVPPINPSSISKNRNGNVSSGSFVGNNTIKEQNRTQNKFNFSNSTNNECSNNYFPNPSNKNEDNKDERSPFFSIFGIDLFFDDILILALLLFLNTEDVKDNYLYIVLIMLLFN